MVEMRDAAVDAAPLGPFGAPQLVAEVSDTSHDDDVTLTGDMLEMYFESDRTTGSGEEEEQEGVIANFFVARRASVTDAWSEPVYVAELSSEREDTGIEITPDGLTI